MNRARLTFALVALSLIGAAVPAQASAAKGGGTPKLGHVFVIVLENENADSTFGPDAPAYLARKLPARGGFVPNYYATGHFSLDNYISMVSGQAPNPQTQADCIFFNDFLPGTPAPDGQVIGSGCVYPAAVKTIADQLEHAGRDWGGYMEDMAASAPAEPAACRHPAIGAQDDTQSAEVGDQYATRHNPFMYFHSIIDDEASCKAHVVDLKKFGADLKRNRTTPAYSFITPNLCHDGHDEPCVNGEPGGLESMNDFLRKYVPKILDSPAYHHRGMLIVTFDEAEAGGDEADSSACCNEQPGPNTPSPGGPHPGPGGGRVGAIMLSPCIRPGTVDQTDYNHYSMLRSLEDGFGLDYLGYAGQAGLKPFGSKLFTRPDCRERIHLGVHPRHPAAGEKTRMKIRVHSPYARCRRDVTVRLGDEEATTNRRGRAGLEASFGKRDVIAHASRKGCVGDSVLISPRSR